MSEVLGEWADQQRAAEQQAAASARDESARRRYEAETNVGWLNRLDRAAAAPVIAAYVSAALSTLEGTGWPRRIGDVVGFPLNGEACWPMGIYHLAYSPETITVLRGHKKVTVTIRGEQVDYPEPNFEDAPVHEWRWDLGITESGRLVCQKIVMRRNEHDSLKLAEQFSWVPAANLAGSAAYLLVTFERSVRRIADAPLPPTPPVTELVPTPLLAELVPGILH